MPSSNAGYRYRDDVIIPDVPADQHPYVHGINRSSDIGRWNMSLQGTLCSSDFAVLQPEFQAVGTRAFRDLSLDILRDIPAEIPTVPSPRGLDLYMASWIRAGMVVGVGAPPYPFHPMPPEAQERLLRRVDMELLLERVRREVDPQAPSRLGCLWLAENTAAGRTWVSHMLGRDIFILPVIIEIAIRLTRLDAGWLPAAPEEANEADARGYWSGEARDHDPQWETLVDGTIRCLDQEQLGLLRQYVADNPPFQPSAQSGT